MSSLILRGATWYLQYRLGGKTRQKSLKTSDAAHAKRLQKIHDGKLEQQRMGIAPRKCSVESSLAEFLEAKAATLRPRSLERYQEQARTVGDWMEKHKVEHWHQFTAQHAEEMVSDWLKVRAPGTVDDTAVFIRSVLKWLWKSGRLSEIPVRQWPTIRTSAAKPDRLGYYTPAEIDALKEFFRWREFRAIFLTGIYTGARREELHAARVGHVRGDVVMLRNLKTEQGPSDAVRALSIHPELVPILAERIIGRGPDEPLFPELKNHSKNWPAMQMQVACRKLKIPYKRFHGLRHTFATYLIAGGVDLRQAMQALGHTRIETTQRYLYAVRSVADTTKLGY